MKAVLKLAALLLVVVPNQARANVVAGNPDQRPSLLLGAGLDWVETRLYRQGSFTDDQVLTASDQKQRRIFGTLTFPTSRSISLLLNVTNATQFEPMTLAPDQPYTRSFSTGASVAFRIYFP